MLCVAAVQKKKILVYNLTLMFFCLLLSWSFSGYPAYVNDPVLFTSSLLKVPFFRSSFAIVPVSCYCYLLCSLLSASALLILLWPLRLLLFNFTSSLVLLFSSSYLTLEQESQPPKTHFKMPFVFFLILCFGNNRKY